MKTASRENRASGSTRQLLARFERWQASQPFGAVPRDMSGGALFLEWRHAQTRRGAGARVTR